MDHQAEYDEYKGKQRYYNSIGAQLEDASKRIKKIKSALDDEERRVGRLTRRLSWKGKTRDSFETFLASLEDDLDTHGDDLDTIHDNINIEKNKAWREANHYGALIEGLSFLATHVENTFN